MIPSIANDQHSESQRSLYRAISHRLNCVIYGVEVDQDLRCEVNRISLGKGGQDKQDVQRTSLDGTDEKCFRERSIARRIYDEMWASFL